MNRLILHTAAAALLACFASCSNGPIAKVNEATSNASSISRDSRAALSKLYASNPGARKLGQNAKAVLVFPSVTRGGLMVGGQTGTGAMIRDTGAISGYYQTTAASYGFQAGIQNFGYALFFMNDDAFKNINRSGGWEIGGSPSLVVVDKGMATSLTNATLNKNTYAVFFNQRGLMAGLGLQGSKISRIYPR
jgi:lipid-binding SYLF domain-containing protein